MTIQEIIEQLKTIKGNYVNGNITGDDTIELIEDIIHDVEGNDGLSWSEDDSWENSFEETDFSQLEVI
tara:strand:- start:1857 stop:2060 length:204 start_codon:yes stop_codon:yes gene_type:complete